VNATVIATYTTHAVIYHGLTEVEVTETVAAIKAEVHLSVEINWEVKALESA
jgi:hypothetical protein